MYQLVCAVVVYDHIQRDDEGWQRLWSDFDGIFDELGIVRMMRDRNGWTGDRVREDITGAFAVAGENRNRRRLIECKNYKAISLLCMPGKNCAGS